MNYLYAPWRDVYLKNKNSQKRADQCPFCAMFTQKADDQNLIIKRYSYCAVVLNLYAYGLGHILVIPYKHVKCLTDLPKEEQYQLMDVMAQSMAILEDHFGCDGINMGLNKGKASGGSVNDHIHIHIVPRFIGDANFLATCALTKTLSFDLVAIYKNLVEHFNK
jgi:ATP adenylyltransferase